MTISVSKVLTHNRQCDLRLIPLDTRALLRAILATSYHKGLKECNGTLTAGYHLEKNTVYMVVSDAADSDIMLKSKVVIDDETSLK